MSNFRYLSAVYRNFIRRLERAVRIADIVIQALMLAYFGFLAYDNFNEPALFYPYVAISAISLFGFIFTLVNNGRKSDTIKKINRVVAIVKWVIRGAVLTINFVLFIIRGGTDTEKLLWVVSLFFLIFQILLDVITREVKHQYQLVLDAIALDVDSVDGMIGHALSALKIKGALAPRAIAAKARSEDLVRLSYLNRIEERLDNVTDGRLIVTVGKKTLTKRRIEKTIKEAVEDAEEILEKKKLEEFVKQFDALADGRPLPVELAEQIQANSYAIHNVGNPNVALSNSTLVYTLAGLILFVRNHTDEVEPDYEYDAFFLDLINHAIIEDYAALPARPSEEKGIHIPFFSKKSEHEEMHGLFKRIKKRLTQPKSAKKEEEPKREKIKEEERK